MQTQSPRDLEDTRRTDISRIQRQFGPGSVQIRGQVPGARRRCQPSSAYRIGQNLVCASASSAAGSDPATMPQPAKSLAFLPPTSPHRSAMPHSPSPLASTQPTGTAAAAPVHALQLADQVHGGLGRSAADRRGRMQRGRQGQRRVVRGLAGRRARRAPACQVLDVGQLEQADGCSSIRRSAQSGASAARTSATPYWCSSWFLAEASSASPSARSCSGVRAPRRVPASTSEYSFLPGPPDVAARESRRAGRRSRTCSSPGYRSASRPSRTRVSMSCGGGRVLLEGEHDLLAAGRRLDRLTAVATARSQAGGVRLPSDQRRPAGGTSGAGVRRVLACRLAGSGSCWPAAFGSGRIVVSQAWPSRRPTTMPGHHQHRAVGGRIEGEAAEGDRAGAGDGDLVGDQRAVEQFAQPFLAGREPVVPGRQRDLRDRAPADECRRRAGPRPAPAAPAAWR